MEHPRERSGLTRRRLLRRAAGSAVALGAARVPRRLREHDRAARSRRRRPDRRRRQARRAEADRARRPAAPSARQRRHLGHHAREPADPRRTPGRAGPAQPLQLRGLHRPGHRQEVLEAVQHLGLRRHLQLGRRGDREARLRRRRLRRDRRPHRVEHRQPHRSEPAPAAQPLVPAEPREEHLAGAPGSVLRPRQPLHGAVRRLDGRHRLAQRQGQDRHRRDGRPVGHLLALPAIPRPRRRARRQARRAQHADAARRDARRRASRPQHRGRCADRQGRA